MPKMQELPLLSEPEGNELFYVVKPDGNGGYTDHMTTLDRIPSEGGEVDLSEYVKTEELDEKLEDYVAKDSVGVANGVASLGIDGKVPAEQLPGQGGSSELNPVDLDFAIETTNQGSTITIFDSSQGNLEPTTGDYITGTLEHVGTEQLVASDATRVFTFKASKNSKFRFKLADNRTYKILALGRELRLDDFGDGMPEMDPDQGPVTLTTSTDGFNVETADQSEYLAYPENFDGWLELEWAPNETLIWRMLGEDYLETPNPDKNTCFNILARLADNGGYDTSFEFAWDLSLSFKGQTKSVNTNLVEDNVIYIANESVKVLNRHLSGGDLVTFYDNKTKLMVHHQADRFVTFNIDDDTNKSTAPSNLGLAEHVTVNDIDKIGTANFPGVNRTTNNPTILGVSNLVGLTFDEVDGFKFEQEWDEENPPSFLEGSADLTLDTSDYFASIRTSNDFDSYICIGTGTLIWDQDHNLSSEDFTGVAIAENSIYFFLDGVETNYIYGTSYYKWNKVTNQIIRSYNREDIPYNVPENSTAKLMMIHAYDITQSQYDKLSIGTVDNLNLSYFSVNALTGEMSLDFSEITDDVDFFIIGNDKVVTDRNDLFAATLIAVIINVRPNGNSVINIFGTGIPTPFDYNVPLTLTLHPNTLQLLQNDIPLVGGSFEGNLQSIIIVDYTTALNNLATYNDFVVSYDFSETAGMSRYTLDNYADGTLIEVTNDVKILDQLVTKGTFIIPTEDKTNFVTLGSGATGSLGENGRYLGVIWTNDGEIQSGLGDITPEVNDYLIATGVNYDNPALMYYDGSLWNQASNLPVDVYQSTIGNNTTGSDLRNSLMIPDTALSTAFWTLNARTTLQPFSRFIDPYTSALINVYNYAYNLVGVIRLSLSEGNNLSIFVSAMSGIDCRFSIIEGIGAGQFVRTTNPNEHLLLNHQLLFGTNDNTDLTIRFIVGSDDIMEMHHFVICFNPAGQDIVRAMVNLTSTYPQT